MKALPLLIPSLRFTQPTSKKLVPLGTDELSCRAEKITYRGEGEKEKGKSSSLWLFLPSLDQLEV